MFRTAGLDSQAMANLEQTRWQKVLKRAQVKPD